MNHDALQFAADGVRAFAAHVDAVWSEFPSMPWPVNVWAARARLMDVDSEREPEPDYELVEGSDEFEDV